MSTTSMADEATGVIRRLMICECRVPEIHPALMRKLDVSITSLCTVLVSRSLQCIVTDASCSSITRSDSRHLESLKTCKRSCNVFRVAGDLMC